LNFISYQKTPKRLFNILKHSDGKSKLTNNVAELPSFETFFSIRTAGIFLAPPLVVNEPFPGAGIFLDEVSMAQLNKSKDQGRLGQSYYTAK